MAETRTIGASKAREEFGDLLNRVAYSRERVVIERSRKPVAAIISLEELRQLDALLEEHGAPAVGNGQAKPVVER